MDAGMGKSQRLRAFLEPLPTWWSKRAFPQEPQVSESNVQEIRVRDGQPGIPCEPLFTSVW